MTMIERWPVRGAEIQVYELTPEEVLRQNRRDNRTRRWATVRCMLRHLGFAPGDYTLIMREHGDTRPDYIQKLDQFFKETTAEERERVLFVLEDDLTVALRWRLRGFTCFVVR